MKKTLFVYFILLLSSYYLCAGNLIDRETYFSPNDTKKIAEKSFYYDDNLNIIKTVQSDKNGNEIIIKYTYSNNFIKTSEEYTNSGLRVQYSVFFYKNGNIEKKEIYTDAEQKVMTSIYKFKNKQVMEIIDYSTDNVYLGKKEYIYSENKLIKEISYNQEDSPIISKKFIYDNLHIIEVLFYFKERFVRKITKSYLDKNGNVSLIGYRDNFWDLRVFSCQGFNLFSQSNPRSLAKCTDPALSLLEKVVGRKVIIPPSLSSHSVRILIAYIE